MGELTMLTHLLQSTLFAICVATLAWTVRRNRASVGHWLWFAASVKFLVPFAILTNLGRQVEPVAPRVAPAIAAAVERAAEPFPESIAFTAPVAPTDWTPWLIAIWAWGTLSIAVKRDLAWLRLRTLIRRSEVTDAGAPIETRIVRGLMEPGVAGIWKPALLLPEGLRDHLTPRQFEAIIAHEMAHVRRRDNLLSLVHMVVEAVFWFHPLVWWIGARLVEERERACDEAVIAEGNDPAEYSAAIVSVCRRYVASPLACVSGVTGADLKFRIEAIFRQDAFRLTWTRKLVLVAAALIAAMLPLLTGVVRAQTEKSFEVASILRMDPSKQLKGGPTAGGVTAVLTNARFVFSANVYSLIMRAYSLPGFMAAMRDQEGPYLTGGPDWIRKDAYIIQATLPAGTPAYTFMQFFEGRAPEVNAMLASLLRDRFQLKFHREDREMPVFTLSLSRAGHKMKPTQAKMVTLSDGTERLEKAFVFRPFATEDGRRMLRLHVVNESMREAAQILSDILDRPVVDRTGLIGNFDFDLEYAADTDNPGVRVELTGPELFTALQEQAGLRLEATRAPIEVVVIDSIERPSEN